MRFILILASVVALVCSHVIHAPLEEDTTILSKRDYDDRRRVLGSQWQAEHKRSLMPRSTAKRSVYYVQTIYTGMGNVAMDGPDAGDMVFPVDSAIFYTQTATEPALMVNLVSWNGSTAIHVYTWPVGPNVSIPSVTGSTPGVVQRNYLVANTTDLNIEIWNPNGVVTNAANSSNNTAGSTYSTGISAHPTGSSVNTSSNLRNQTSGRAAFYSTMAKDDGRTALQRGTGVAKSTGTVLGGNSMATSDAGLKRRAELNVAQQSWTSSKWKRGPDSGYTKPGLIQLIATSEEPRGLGYIEDIASIYKSRWGPGTPAAPKPEPGTPAAPEPEGEKGYVLSAKEMQDFASFSSFSPLDSLEGDSAAVYVEAEGDNKPSVSRMSFDGTKGIEIIPEIPSDPPESLADALSDRDPVRFGIVGKSPNIAVISINPTEMVVSIEGDPEDGKGNPEGGESNPGGGESDSGGGESNPGGGESDSGGGESNPGGGESDPGGEESDPGVGTPKDGGTSLQIYDPADVKVSMSSIGGKLTMALTVTAEVANALAIVASIAFFIVDFADGQYFAGAMSAASVGLVVASYVVADFCAIGGAILGVAAVFLAFLPGIIMQPKPKASSTNGTEILQWSFYGDKEKTGNEKCQQGSPAINGSAAIQGNSTCIGTYGAGVLARGLGLTNYDATVLSIWANDGFPITIPDLVAKMCIKNDRVKNQCTDAPFVVDCKNIFGSLSHHGQDDGRIGFDTCYQPTYSVQKTLITLPILNQTADITESRIIGGPKAIPNADCKIVQWPGPQSFPKYNLTLTGMPSGIACGIKPQWNISGGASSYISSGADSTTGQNGAEIPLAPLAPFVIPGPSPNYLCLEDPAEALNVCLPPSQYSSQDGRGFDLSKVTSLTIPPGFSLITSWVNVPFRALRKRIDVPTQPIPVTVSHTYTPGSPTKEFIPDMKSIHRNANGPAFFNITGPSPPDPLVCLFDQTQFKGNVLCLGPGAGNLSSIWQNAAQSAKIWGAKVVFYSQYYGSIVYAPSSGDVPDFASLIYGTNQGLSKNVSALSIQPGD